MKSCLISSNVVKRKPFLTAALLLCVHGFFLFPQEALDGGWVRFGLTGNGPFFAASSVLEADAGEYRSRYSSDKALDADPDTAWVEGVPGDGAGEKFFLGTETLPEALGVINGYAKNENLFIKNNRVKSLNITVFAAVNVSGFAGQWQEFYDARKISDTRTVILEDTDEPQCILLSFDRNTVEASMEGFCRSEALGTWDFPQAREMGLRAGDELERKCVYILQLEIGAVYAGTTWKDTCIAELWPDYGPVQSAAVQDDDSTLVITLSGNVEIPVYHDPDSVLTLLEVSHDNEWAIIIREPSVPGSGPLLSEYKVFHVPTGRDVTRDILGSEPGTLLPYAFSYEGGQHFVEYERFDDGRTGRAECALYH
ncbi:MAG: hypothetical protein JXB03_09775 [Spirochaetales bacterium]|nr:hypothetical protein [Spirochaetales bacterium]